MKTGTVYIHEERIRQIKSEGWSSDHDDEHRSGELANAAACYAMAEDYRDSQGDMVNGRLEWERPLYWPWSIDWRKPTPNDRIKELSKAGALIAAEIDRLIRLKNHE